MRGRLSHESHISSKGVTVRSMRPNVTRSNTLKSKTGAIASHGNLPLTERAAFSKDPMIDTTAENAAPKA
jgi:hypothetical protein